jgi:hypothetical protein
LFLGVACWLAILMPTTAQTIVTSVTPHDGAVNVPVNTTIVFTFSTPMNPDTNTTMVVLMDMANPMAPIMVNNSWNALDTILTCTPKTQLPAGKMLYWVLNGETADGTSISESEGFGKFTTSTGGNSDCTNEISSFTAAKGYMYSQNSTGPAQIQTNFPYALVACTTLACSNFVATNVSVAFPNGIRTNLPSTSIPLHLSYTGVGTSQSSFESTFPNGPYTFTVQEPGASYVYTVTLSPSLVQPPAPHITNFLQAQSIDASKPFTLGWDAFAGGTAADCITVEIYGGIFATPALGSPNALNGTAKNVVIPAGTFQPNHNYTGAVSFYHYSMPTNGFVALSYRSSVTEFNLSTFPASNVSLAITNQALARGALSFEVLSGVGQSLVLESSSNLPGSTWQTLLSTNSPGRFPFTDPRPATNRSLFYRLRTP